MALLQTYDLFKTDVFNQYNFEQINIAGHPEGNPNDPDSNLNLFKKLHWLTDNNYNSSIITQWTFNTELTNSWIKNIIVISNNDFCFISH